MTGRGTFIVLMSLCGLAFGAIAAQSATAVPIGTTAFTCSSEAPKKDFKTEHCVPGEGGTAFGHVVIPELEETEIKATNAKTNAATNGPTNMAFHSTIAGVKFTITATNMKGEGLLANAKTLAGEHFIGAESPFIEFTGVTISNPNCAVEGLPGALGVIKTKVLEATTLEHGMGVKFEAQTAELLAEFRIVKSGAMACALAGTYPVIGRLTGIPNGATINFDETETTNSGTLHLGSAVGPVAGFKGVITVTGKERVTPDTATKPLTATTIEKP